MTFIHIKRTLKLKHYNIDLHVDKPKSKAPQLVLMISLFNSEYMMIHVPFQDLLLREILINVTFWCNMLIVSRLLRICNWKHISVELGTLFICQNSKLVFNKLPKFNFNLAYLFK